MICPILQAGVMVKRLESHAEVLGQVKFDARLVQDVAFCMKENCEWYKKGCPAHPEEV
jgi:hypothetical protein